MNIQQVNIKIDEKALTNTISVLAKDVPVRNDQRSNSSAKIMTTLGFLAESKVFQELCNKSKFPGERWTLLFS